MKDKKKINKKKFGIGRLLCEVLLISLFVAGSYACLIKYDVIPKPSIKSLRRELEVTENVNIGIGQKFNVNVGVESPDKVIWKSIDDSIAKVDNGIIEGVAIGETYVTVETGSGEKQTIYVYVSANNMPSRAEEATNSTYIITYYPNGGTGQSTNTVCSSGKSCAVSGNIFKKDNYTFIGWTTKKEGTNDGYNWTGWSGTWKFKNGENGINNNRLLLYAMWDKTSNSANRYTISYDNNGGVGTIPSQICVHGQLCVINSSKPIRDGYTFGGWATAKEGKAYNWTNWKGTWGYKNGQYGIANNKLVLYARWTKNEKPVDTTTGEKFTIKYMPNGGSGSEQTQTCYKGKTCTIKSLDTFTRSEYKMVKWRTTSSTSVAGYNWTNWSGTFNFSNGQYGINNNTLTLYATWEKTSTTGVGQYKIVYNSNDGNNKTTTQTCIYGQTCTIKPLTTYSRSGYKMVKWRTTSSTSVAAYNWTNWSGTWKFTNGQYGVQNNQLILYATWESNSGSTEDIYTIKYMANGGTGNMTDQKCTYGKTCTIKPSSYSKQNYTFNGWTTKSDGKDDGYGWTGFSGTWNFKNGTKGIKNKTLTLYAMWKKQETTSTNYAEMYFMNVHNTQNILNSLVNDATNKNGYSNGESFILKTAEGKYVLIDTGHKNDAIVTNIYNQLKTLQKKDKVVIDYILITHAHGDHTGNLLSIINHSKITVKNVIIKKESKNISTYNNAVKAMANKGKVISPSTDGQEIKLDNYVSLLMFNTKDVYADKGQHKGSMIYFTSNPNKASKINGKYYYFDGSKYPNIKYVATTKLVKKHSEIKDGLDNYFYAKFDSDLRSDQNPNSNSLATIIKVSTKSGNRYMYITGDLDNGGYDIVPTNGIYGNGRTKLYNKDKMTLSSSANSFTGVIDSLNKVASETNSAKSIKSKLGSDVKNITIYQAAHHGLNNAPDAINILGINNKNVNTIIPVSVDTKTTRTFHQARTYYYTLSNTKKYYPGGTTKKGVQCVITNKGTTTCKNF